MVACMWWGVSSPGGFGIPFGMFLFPLLIVLCRFFVFSRRRGPCGCSLRNGDADVTNRELLEEVRRLRQEVEALKSDKNQ